MQKLTNQAHQHMLHGHFFKDFRKENWNEPCTFFLPVEFAASAEMQFPRVLKDWLIFLDSSRRSPVAPVLAALSLESKLSWK